MTLPRRAFLIALSLPGWKGASALPQGAGLPSRDRVVEGQQDLLPRQAAVDSALRARQAGIQGAYRGVNLSGAEFAHDALHLPGVADKDYRYPTAADLRYVAGRGHRMVRLPIRWERIQPTLLGPLHPAELHRLTKARR